MRVRIVKHLPRALEGVDLERFHLDGVYDVAGAVLDLLMISGYAVEVVDPPRTSRQEALRVFADAQIGPQNPSVAAFQAVHTDAAAKTFQRNPSVEHLDRIRRTAKKLARSATKQIVQARSDSRSTSPAARPGISRPKKRR